MTKPTKPDWANGDPSYIIEPGSGKKTVGWTSGEKPPFQYMNWIHNVTDGWLDWLESRVENESACVLRSNHPIYWSGSVINFSANIQIAFRQGADAYINQIAAGTITLNDGQVVVARLNRTGSSPVTLALQATYGNLAIGEYCIVNEASLSDENDSDEVILFRRHDVSSGNDVFGVGYSALEIPISRQIVQGGQTFGLSTITPIQSSIPPLVEGCYNMQLKLNAGVMSIVGSNGNSLSEYNVGWVVMRSQLDNTKLVRLRVTSSPSWIDDSGSSDIVGEQFGRTTGIAWGDNLPFTIYAINADDTAANLIFGHSPDPTKRLSPATANLGYKGNPASTPSDENLWCWTSTNITTSHDLVSCLAIGSFRAIMSTSDDWTVTTLDTYDGIGIFNYEHQEFEMSSGQMGAATGKFFANNGGTAPSFSSDSYRRFKLHKNGQVDYFFAFQSGTNGSGAVNAQLAAPYKCYTAVGSVEARYSGAGRYSNSGVGAGLLAMDIAENTSIINLYQDDATSLQYSDFGVTDNNVYGTIRYQAFGKSF